MKQDDHNQGIPGEIAWSHEGNVSKWQKLQYGMFIHWGLYSELGGEWNGEPVKKGYSEQIQMWANISEEDYTKVAENFTAENFDAEEIVSLAKRAGMKYIVITSKHHDGFSLFDTKTTDYNTVKMTPFAKDAIKLLADECAKQGLKFGLYYSLVDWHQGHEFNHQNNNTINEHIEGIIEEQLRELLTNYGPIAEVWFDMSSPTVEQSNKFAGIVRELQPDAAINGRIWNNRDDFRTLADNQVPDITLEGAWQTPASIYRETWGYRKWQERDDFDGKVRDLTATLASVVARGGNYLLNIGPRGDGSIVEFEAEVLEAIGEWLDRHPNAVLGAKATHIPEQSWGEVTVNGQNLFLHIKNWPETGEITLPGLVTNVNHVEEDFSGKELAWEFDGNTLTITLPETPADDILPVVNVELAGDLYIIPEKTVATSAAGEWTVAMDDLYTGYSYADDGHYFSLYQTEVRHSAYLENDYSGTVTVQVKGTANADKKYQVELGGQTVVVSGSELTGSAVGPFEIDSANKIVPLNITLAEPDFSNEDLAVEIESIVVKKS